MVHRKRHLAKAVTYRIFGTIGTSAVAYIVTGDARIGATVGVLDSAAKIWLYYLHERLWYRVRWGVGERECEDVSETRRGIHAEDSVMLDAEVEAKPGVLTSHAPRT